MPLTLAGRRVLVVEDEYFIADELAENLRNLGADVVGPVANRTDALVCLRQGGLDLAIIDLNLSGEPSFVIADALAERGIPFVFATGYDEEAIPEQYRHVPRWEKPFDAAVLAEAMAAIDMSGIGTRH